MNTFISPVECVLTFENLFHLAEALNRFRLNRGMLFVFPTQYRFLPESILTEKLDPYLHKTKTLFNNYISPRVKQTQFVDEISTLQRMSSIQELLILVNQTSYLGVALKKAISYNIRVLYS